MAIVEIKVPYIKGLSKENIYIEGSIVDKGYVIKIEYVSDGKVFYVEIEDGKYTFKYIYEDNIRLNEEMPYNYVIENGEVWSVIKIVKGRKVNRSLHIPLILQKVKISNKILLPHINLPDCRRINKKLDKGINISVYCSGYSGVHSITAIWRNPYGVIYALEEKSIELDVPQLQYVYVRLYMGIRQEQYIYEGIWSVDLYIDGKCLATEAFEIYSGVYGNHPIIDCYM